MWSVCVSLLIQVTQRWYATRQLFLPQSFIPYMWVTKDAFPVSVFLCVASRTVQNIPGIKWFGGAGAWEAKTAIFLMKITFLLSMVNHKSYNILWPSRVDLFHYNFLFPQQQMSRIRSPYLPDRKNNFFSLL